MVTSLQSPLCICRSFTCSIPPTWKKRLHFSLLHVFTVFFAASDFCTTRVNLPPPGPKHVSSLSCGGMQPPYEDTSFRAFTFQAVQQHIKFIPSSSTMNSTSHDVNSHLHPRVFKPFDAPNLLLSYIHLPLFHPAANTCKQPRYTSLTTTKLQTIYIVERLTTAISPSIAEGSYQTTSSLSTRG